MKAIAQQKPSRNDLRWSFGLLVALGAGIGGLVGQAQAQDASNYQVVGSIAAYLGLMPAEIAAGHPQNHPEVRMHGGPPGTSHAEHIIIALFEEPSNARIEDASISATISGLGHVAATPITLDPMLIAGVVTYGGYVTFPGPDTYSIDLQISRPGSPKVTAISFKYEHGSN